MLVLVLVTLVIFLISAAFCVDIAYMHMVRAELRTATDAASRAGSSVLTRTQDADQGIDAALQFAERNVVAGNALTLDRSDIQVGESEQNGVGRFSFNPGGATLNAVRVVSSRDDGGPDGSVGLFFGNIFNTPVFEPSADAISTASVRDIALVLDRSGSMNGPVAGGSSKLNALQNAVQAFMNEVRSTSPNSNISLTTYSTGSTRDVPLTANFGTIQNQVNNLNAAGFTNIFQGLRDGSDSLDQDAGRRGFAERTIVVMTDGNFNVGGTPVPSANLAANRGHTIHTITFGSANQAIMRECADIGGGIHLHADSAGDLTDAFREIARTISVLTID
ncbi:MAG: vWA domain-containing protein [Planctomycetota bacterium]